MAGYLRELARDSQAILKVWMRNEDIVYCETENAMDKFCFDGGWFVEMFRDDDGYRWDLYYSERYQPTWTTNNPAWKP